MAMDSIYLAFGILCILNRVTNCQFTCDPVVDCYGSGVGNLVPDPCNCEKYYLCINGNGSSIPSTSPLPCDSGYYFDQTYRNCSLEEVPGSCNNLCQPRCTTECPPDGPAGINVANERDCSSYYICLPPGPALVECPVDSPYFNGTTCTADPLQCCNFCRPYCNKENTQIQDPCDCSSYYICLSTGQPSANTKFICDTGTYYDENTGDCTAGSCIPKCSVEQCGSSGYIC